jgi:tol-pal system protein YbgF
MKKLIAVVTLSFLAFACSDETQIIKQSINNIKDEMVSMQSDMAEMKISIEDIDRKTEMNKESIGSNSNALAEVRSEMNFISSEVTAMKEKKSQAPMSSSEAAVSMTGDAGAASGDDQLIIIEDTFTDKSSLYSYAYELYKNGKYPESQAKFNEFLAKYPADELSDNAVYWLGEIQYALKDYDAAITVFHKLVTDYPEGNKVSDGLLKMAYSYGNVGKKAEAVVTLKKIVNEHPGTRAYNLAKKKLAAWGE